MSNVFSRAISAITGQTTPPYGHPSKEGNGTPIGNGPDAGNGFLEGNGQVEMMATGYGNHGASRTKNTMIGWITEGGSAEDDIDLHGKTLRIRSRDLDAGGGLPRAAASTETTTVIGVGLKPKPVIDYEALNMDEAKAREWERAARREFLFWAESKFSDAAEKKNFFQLQALAFRSFYVSGDVFAMLPTYASIGTPYKTHIRLLEADRIATPDSYGESESKATESGTGRIIDGVEIDATGRVRAYHVASRHPLSAEQTESVTYERIEARGKITGMPNILHVYVPERPEQMRGIPTNAPIIEQAKQLDRYINSELSANVIAAMFTLFITESKEGGSYGNGLEDAVNESESVTDDNTKLQLKSGAVYQLEPGQKPEAINPMRPNSAFKDFIDAMFTQVGASIEMPKEVMLKAFTRSYSASRAALLEYWRKIPMARQNFVYDFCQPIYEAVITEAVALGRLPAPGFFDDPMTRKAWLGCNWIGSTMGQLDPLKEINAAEKRIKLNISTEEREASEFNGSDWSENIRQRRREVEEAKALFGTDITQAADETIVIEKEEPEDAINNDGDEDEE